MTTFTYSLFKVRNEAHGGLILYRNGEPLMVLSDRDQPGLTNYTRFLLETLGARVNNNPMVSTIEELAEIEKQTRGNEHLFPKMAFPPEILTSHYMTEVPHEKDDRI